jgi:hypothetical protein
VEVVEVSSYLPSWLAVGRDLPALQGGHLLGEIGLLDGSGHPHLLLNALAFTHLFIKTLLKWAYVPLAPLLDDLASSYTVDIHRFEGPLRVFVPQ